MEKGRGYECVGLIYHCFTLMNILVMTDQKKENPSPTVTMAIISAWEKLNGTSRFICDVENAFEYERMLKRKEKRASDTLNSSKYDTFQNKFL